MNLKEQMLMGSSYSVRRLVIVLESLIQTVNELSAVVFSGSNPHKVNDTANGIADSLSAGDLNTVADLEAALAVNYAAHLGSTTYHLAADSTNTLTATSVLAKVNALSNDLKAKYNAHRVRLASVHTAADNTNVVDAANATTKATAITLLNQIKAKFNAHCALTPAHGAADAVNPIILADLGVAATWEQIQAMADQLRVSYEAHRVLTAGSVHGAADSTNTMAVAAVGSVQTSVNTLLNELKTDFNAHMSLLTSHAVKDTSMEVTGANSTTLATAIKLANELREKFNDHISRGPEIAMVVPTLDSLE